jgi:spore germination cell wall hydrolase CwlJ-like protein
MNLFKYSWNPLEDIQEPAAPTVERKGIFQPPSSGEKLQQAEDWRKQFKEMLASYWGSEQDMYNSIKVPEIVGLDEEEMRVYEEWYGDGGIEYFSAVDDATAEESTNLQAQRIRDSADASFEMSPKKTGLMVKPDSVIDVPEYKVYDSPDEMSELEILARTIEAEAASEEYDGKVAVGATIANRAASGKYGKGIKGVILKRGQFSPWNSWTGYAKGEQGKDMMKLKPSEDSYSAAQAILSGDYEDITGGATHYVNPEISTPNWLDEMMGRKRGTVQVGRHLFGNADSNQTYDGKSWITKRFEPTRPKSRPEDL